MKIDKKIISYEPNSIVEYYFPVQYVFIMYDKKYIVIQKEENETYGFRECSSFDEYFLLLS